MSFDVVSGSVDDMESDKGEMRETTTNAIPASNMALARCLRAPSVGFMAAWRKEKVDSLLLQYCSGSLVAVDCVFVVDPSARARKSKRLSKYTFVPICTKTKQLLCYKPSLTVNSLRSNFRLGSQIPRNRTKVRFYNFSITMSDSSIHSDADDWEINLDYHALDEKLELNKLKQNQQYKEEDLALKEREEQEIAYHQLLKQRGRALAAKKAAKGSLRLQQEKECFALEKESKLPV